MVLLAMIASTVLPVNASPLLWVSVRNVASSATTRVVPPGTLTVCVRFCLGCVAAGLPDCEPAPELSADSGAFEHPEITRAPQITVTPAK